MRFEELDYQQTPLGELILRVRHSPSAGGDVYEVKLDGAFLMSSLINHSEIALAELGLKALGEKPAAVCVGGLGLGYTAAAALDHANVTRVRVVEYLQPVIGWHQRKLVPAAERLTGDPRCELVHADFFEHVAGQGAAEYDAILLDIDHSPESLLHERHSSFYSSEGLGQLATHLRPGGVFALWSAAAPPQDLLDRLGLVFEKVRPHTVRFYNALLHEPEENTVVVAQLPGA